MRATADRVPGIGICEEGVENAAENRCEAGSI